MVNERYCTILKRMNKRNKQIYFEICINTLCMLVFPDIKMLLCHIQYNRSCKLTRFELTNNLQ